MIILSMKLSGPAADGNEPAARNGKFVKNYSRRFHRGGAWHIVKKLMDDIEQRIREHAFALWEAAGCPENRADEFWFRAREVELGLSQPSEPDIDETLGGSFPASDPPTAGDFA